MSLSLLFRRRLCPVDDRNEPVPIVTEVKDDITVYGIGILKDAPQFLKMLPPCFLDDGFPKFDFVRRVPVFCHRLVQVLFRDDVHSLIILHMA